MSRHGRKPKKQGKKQKRHRNDGLRPILERDCRKPRDTETYKQEVKNKE